MEQMTSFLRIGMSASTAVFVLSLSSLSMAAPESGSAEHAGDRPAIPPLATPIHDYYVRLAKLSGEPAGPNLALDAQRFPTARVLVEEALSHTPNYLTVSLSAFELRPPPANSSLQTRAELDYLLRLQEQRTLIEMAANLDLQNWGYVVNAKPTDRDFSTLRDNFFRVGRSIGTWFNAQKLPKTADLVARTWQDARFYMWSFKDKYARMRPYQLEPKIKNLQETNWPAYPSGHASFAYMLGYLYSAISPAHREIFLHDAYVIAHSREIIGVHFPSDSEAGRVFAYKLIELLLQNEGFLQDLKIAQAEWEAAARDFP